MRGFIFIDNNKKDEFLDVCFNAYWRDNLDISKEENLNKILDKCKIDHNLFKKGINDQEIKDKLKLLTSNAFENDVFGAPTFVVNKKLFWGQDRLDYALDELKN